MPRIRFCLCGEWSWKTSPKGERPGEEGWPCGCLGEECSTPREPDMGTVSVSEEQPGGQCGRQRTSKDDSRDRSQGLLGPPRPIVRALALPLNEIEACEWKEGHDLI